MRYLASLLIPALMSLPLSCTAVAPVSAEPSPGLVQLAMPTLSCDTLPQLQSLVNDRQTSWDKFKAAFIAMQAQRDKFGEPPCIYEQLGMIAVGDKKEDIVDLGIQKPDQADHADHVWLVHVSNPVTDFWLLWAEKVAEPAACVGRCI